MKPWPTDRTIVQGSRFRRDSPVFPRLTWGNASSLIPRISRDQRQIAAVGCIWLRSLTTLRSEKSDQKCRSEPVFRGRAEGVGFEPTRSVTTPNGFQDHRHRPLGEPSSAPSLR